jgi:hypothetical protein
MNEQNKTNSGAEIFLMIIGCIVGAAIAYAVIMIVLVLASMLAVVGIAGAGYLGFRLANDKALWQLRRAQEASRLEEEKAFHLRSAPTHIQGKIENFFDDEQDKAYEREDAVSSLAKHARNVREMFR